MSEIHPSRSIGGSISGESALSGTLSVPMVQQIDLEIATDIEVERMLDDVFD